MTPLFLSAADAGPVVVKALLSKGSRVNEPNQRKLTPLIAAEADVNAKDRNGDSLLDWALKYRNPDVLTILKAAGAKSAFLQARFPSQTRATHQPDWTASASSGILSAARNDSPETAHPALQRARRRSQLDRR